MYQKKRENVMVLHIKLQAIGQDRNGMGAIYEMLK